MSHSKDKDLLQEFLTSIKERDILKKVCQIYKITTSVNPTREKLVSNKSGLVGVDNCPLDLTEDERNQLLDLFEEDVARARELLTDIELGLAHSSSILSKLKERLSDQLRQGSTEELTRALSAFEDCRGIFKYLQLRSITIKYNLLIPPTVSVDPDPPSFEDQDEAYLLLLAKLELFLQD